MHGRVRAIGGHRVIPLTSGWELAAAPPDTVTDAAALHRATLDWCAASVPGTAADALRAAGRWSLDGSPRRFDADDWWYRLRFASDAPEAQQQVWLCFDGLATVADVWINGQLLFGSESMFAMHERRVDALLRPENELLLRFRSLDARLRERRPRPRWRAPMVENQQIRWFRTTLLGRTPGWSPPAQAVGPWRPVRLEYRSVASIADVRLSAHADGVLQIRCAATPFGEPVRSAACVLSREDGGDEITADLHFSDTGIGGSLRVADARQWWPHTHGEPTLYSARLRVACGTETLDVDLGRVGFRDVRLDSRDGAFGLTVNGAPVFCRGACWTPLDPVSLNGVRETVDHAVAQVVDAGMNMLRVGGTMVYESDEFLDACDQRGVLLWQDLMFANLDYPEDPQFVAAVTAEATQQMFRLQGRPAVAVLCGNSEVSQQASMWGAARELWQPALFHSALAGVAETLCPDVPYWPCSTHGGDFPHQSNVGTSSYYGVGAYLRPLDDARRADVRFASECLAFANIPEPRTLAALPGGAGVKVHDPAWKGRAPRDLGAGWDFEDVRDHYADALFGIEGARLRYSDHERYLELGRVATGEVMARAYAEWRRCGSRTTGALIWFLRDLWVGAGWGIVDATGLPKAPWHFLRRALAPVAVFLTDEGTNGLTLHLVSDQAVTRSLEVELSLYRFGELLIGRSLKRVDVPGRSAVALNAASFFDEFLDLSYAYRFGPPQHDTIVAVARDASGAAVSRAFHFVRGLPAAREVDIGLEADGALLADGTPVVTVRTRKVAIAVTIDVEGMQSDDNYFHMAPGDERRLSLRPLRGGAVAARGVVRALNSESSVTVAFR